MKKNVAGQKVGAQLVSATDGSAFTGSVTVYVTLDAGTQAAGSVGSGACTHEGNGYHTYAPAQAETNGDLVAFTFVGTGAVPASVQVYPSFPQTGDAFDRLGAPAGASVSADVAAVKTQTAAIEVDTQDIQSRIPAALVSGRIDASVGAMASNTLTAAAIAADAITAAKVAADVSAEIADAVWDEAIAGHASAGSTGEALGAAGSAGDPWSTALPGSYSAGQAGYIIGTNINATVSSRATQTSVDTVDGVVDAILVDTAEIGAAGAGLTALASASNLAVVAGYLDTEIGAIKAKTDNLPASPAATGDIPSASAIADAVLDEALSGHTTAGSLGKAISDTDQRGSRTVIRGTVDSGASTTSIPTSAFSPAGASADQFKGRIVVFDNDTATAALRGEATDITASSNSATPTLTVTALSATPASGDSFSVL